MAAVIESQICTVHIDFTCFLPISFSTPCKMTFVACLILVASMQSVLSIIGINMQSLQYVVTSVQFPCNQQYVMCVWTSEYFLRQVCVCYVRNAWKIYWQILLKWCWPSHSCNRKDIVLLIIFLQVAYLTRSKWTESPHIDISEVKFPASVSDILSHIWFTTSGLFLSAFLHGCWYLFPVWAEHTYCKRT